MKKYLNGKLVDMTAEETASLESAQTDAATAKRNRPPPPPSELDVLRRAIQDKGGPVVTDADMATAQQTLMTRST